ncbi:MAG: signal recognition particle-docking protein FtsY [Alphaproteobacteria bacterium]|nr:signal recognition particle-docking protein FtsY [Alphaproteobacteria bacterium]
MSGFFNKLKSALNKTSDKLSAGIENIFNKKKLDLNSLNELEELLISSDTGVKVAGQIIELLKKKKFDKEITVEEVKLELALTISQLMEKNDRKFQLNNGLNIILVCGVNGNGKSTSIGKLASFYTQEGKKVGIAACDTFRAAATDQIAKWAERAGAILFTGEENSDPASVAYRAVTESYDRNLDILFIDTAGRLHNQKNLMDELAKIVRVIQKVDQSAPHHILLVIDATTGQNAFIQTEEFKRLVPVSGLVVTKLDGTAKAGVIIGISEKNSLPVYFIGVGEGVDDLKLFSSIDFAKALVNVN